MKIKATIFDLDDTLFDCTGSLIDSARRSAAKVLSECLSITEEEAYNRQIQMPSRHPKSHVFDSICRECGIHDQEKINAIVSRVLKAYNSVDVRHIRPFPDVISTLKKLKEKGLLIILITTGIFELQRKKIETLGIDGLFDEIIINAIEKNRPKEEHFRYMLDKYNLNAEEVISIGDRIDSEIKHSNRLGMITVQMLHGHYMQLRPETENEKPDYRVHDIGELTDIIELIEKTNNKKIKIVAIGGGTGLPIVLNATKNYANVTAIVTVTDTGKSSGILRNELGMPPPGDIRNCLIALSDSEKLFHDLFGYRFTNGGLVGHSFGNLFIAALSQLTGSFEEAIKETSRILNIRGTVLPSTEEQTNICAELEDGTIIEGEDNIVDRNNRWVHLRPRIRRVFLKPNNCSALDEALQTIEAADMIVISPGSLFTSIISNLLVKDISYAITNSRAKKVYICNIMTQPSQTSGFKVSDHVKNILDCLGDKSIDYVVINNNIPTEEIMGHYIKHHADIVEFDREETEKLGTGIIEADLTDTRRQQEVWNKLTLLSHDPKKLGKVLMKIASRI